MTYKPLIKLYLLSVALALPTAANARTAVYGQAYDANGNAIPNTFDVYEVFGVGDQGGANTVATNWGASEAAAQAATNPLSGPAVTGHLASATNAGHNAWLHQLGGRGSTWIGLTDDHATWGGTEAGSDANGGWVWTNGDNFSYQNFASGEPNDSGGAEDAAHIRDDKAWNDHKTDINGQTGGPDYRAVVHYRTQIGINDLDAFKVTTYKAGAVVAEGGEINGLPEARQLIDASGPYPNRTSNTQNSSVASIGGSNVWFGPNATYQGGGGDHFVVQGTGQLVVGAGDGGDYTFGIAGDDGGSFSIDLNQDNDFNDAGENVIFDNTLHGNQGHFGEVSLVGGQSYDFEWVGFEQGGGDGWDAVYSKGLKETSGEVTDGTFPSGVTTANGWVLVGDGTQGITTTDALGGGGAAGLTLTEFYRATAMGIDVDGLAAADALIANNHNERATNFGDNDDGQFTVYLPTVDIEDSGGGTNNFGGGTGSEDGLPGFAGSDQDDYVVLAEGYISLTAGDWTLGGNSDDGQRIRIDLNGDGIYDATKPGGCCGNTAFLNVNIATDGFYKVEYLFWENGGGAHGELFAAPGTHTSFDGNGFALVGSPGGLQVSQVPEPSSAGVLGLIGLLGLARVRRRKGGAKR